MNKKGIIIDSHSLLYKAFYGVREMRSSDGTPTNAVYGFMNMLLKLIKDNKPDFIVAAFDAGRTTFRTEIFGDYKAGRDHMPEDMGVQIGIVTDIMKQAGIKIISLPGFEADDIIGSFSRMNAKEGNETFIVTGDRDSFQLSSDDTTIVYARKGVTDTVFVTPRYITDTYGLSPRQLIDLKALMGDKSDNIPGVSGVGEKTALNLIKEYGSLDGVYENIGLIQGKLKEKLTDGKQDAYLSLKLGTIKTDIELDCRADELTFDVSSEGVAEILRKYELNNILKQIGVSPTKKESISQENIVNNVDSIPSFDGKTVAVMTENYTENGCDICFYDGKQIYLKKNADKNELAAFFENTAVNKITHDIKTQYKKLFLLGIKPRNLIFDTFIAAYLLSATDERYSIENLSAKYLEYTIEKTEQPMQQSLFGNESAQQTAICEKTRAVYDLYGLFSPKLEENGLNALYHDIEHRLIFVLAEMELTGFKIDKKNLETLGVDFDKRCAEINGAILELSGKDSGFNVNSSKQLGELLFNELGLPALKKTKTGFSTDIEVLEKLKGQHPIIPLIIEQRQIAKLNSTYVKGLIKLADKNDRIHTSFNQTITTTGRISSSEPNLQNIPVRTDEGRVLRKAFVASEKGRILVDADYSQIELRILAHISGDKNMLDAFANKEDIHTRTASEVFGVNIDEVTPLQRSQAKAVNFGIVYGISDYGLSKNTGISRKEARLYIDTYLEKFSGVKRFMSDIVDFAKDKGYVETLYHRRRYIPDINSVSFTARSFAERTALNSPIQGTAADIIKIAMVNVSERLKKEHLKSELILQVHDELIIDAYKEEEAQVLSVLKEEMESAAVLSVPLTVEISSGYSWYDAK